MKILNKRPIFTTSLVALAVLALSACNNLHTKEEFADDEKAELEQQLVAQQSNQRDSRDWYIEGCPWYGCTQRADLD